MGAPSPVEASKSTAVPGSSANRRAFRDGARDFAPIILGVIPFGAIAGIAAMEAGLSVTQAIGMSIIILAGASQLATIDLLAQDAALVTIVFTALIINARFVMYSASLAGYVKSLPRRHKATVAYLLTDQAYAFSITRYVDRPESPGARFAYYSGVGVTLWVVWQVSTAAGAMLGAFVPEGLSLDFAIPLVFIALLVPALRETSDVLAATVAAVVSVSAIGMPFNLSLITAAFIGIAAGVVTARRTAT
jgi:4-azaleucine resistance transporter AzlC